MDLHFILGESAIRTIGTALRFAKPIDVGNELRRTMRELRGGCPNHERFNDAVGSTDVKRLFVMPRFSVGRLGRSLLLGTIGRLADGFGLRTCRPTRGTT